MRISASSHRNGWILGMAAFQQSVVLMNTGSSSETTTNPPARSTVPNRRQNSAHASRHPGPKSSRSPAGPRTCQRHHTRSTTAE